METMLGSIHAVNDLDTLRERLERHDPSLAVFEPWRDSSLLFSMEEPQLRNSLYSCLAAGGRARSIRRVVLRNLPEPELAYALKCLAKNPHITQLHVTDDTKSHSIQASSVVDFLTRRRDLHGSGKGLQKLHISTKIEISSECHVQDLARTLALRSLQSVTLHILPRCPIRNPTICVDPIAKTLALLPKLKCLQLVLGYQYNPYGSPMMSVSSCNALLAKDFLKLRLTNCGLKPLYIVYS